MTNRVIGDFKQFLNEAEDTQDLKGIPFQELMDKLVKLTDLTSDSLSIGTPADIYGHSTSYKTDLSEVQARLADIDHYFASKMKQEVKFYCWNLNWKDYSSGRELEKKLSLVNEEKINIESLDPKALGNVITNRALEIGLETNVKLSNESIVLKISGFKNNSLENQFKKDIGITTDKLHSITINIKEKK